ncbi:Protein of unknown function [Nitrosospira briensis]|uniref:DUF4197 domain-containing protein n=1 Tax=Nitrosospira briensis TaxID=35799 RepID=A0A1I5D754_9PROT|nr:DUF4197 domain-containing protein [Nitrosospira briensis]SFN95094.1 Protein of unknown function [Nitrosospira briensis]
MRITTVFLVGLCISISACASGATGADSLSDEDIANGLKQALTQGAHAAVDKLGVMNGFLENPKVKIQLPGSLQKVEGVMRTVGLSKHADSLVTTMNRAAETVAAEAKPLLVNAVQEMSVEDARGILAGGNDAATQYFRNTTSDALSQKFLPIVKNATDQAGLLKKYNEFARKGAKLGLVTEENANIENYLTQKTLDGIFLMMAEEERAIRDDPMGQGNKLLQRMFGSLK